MEWTSVKDDPPEVGKAVLVTWKLSNGKYAEPEKHFRFHKAARPNQESIIWTCGTPPELWQPLPEPPTDNR